MEGVPNVSKPIYEIPVTDPADPPIGLPGAPGATPPPRGVQPPMPPGSTTVDLSQLPPPAVATVDAAASASAPPPRGGPESLPGFTPAPQESLLRMPQFDGDPLPPPAGYGNQGIPTAPPEPYLPMPDFEVLPPPSRRYEEKTRDAFVADEFTVAARAKVDSDLLYSLEMVVTEGGSDLHISAGSPPMIRVDGALRHVPEQGEWDRERVASALYSLLTDEQTAQFDDALELDFAFTLSEDARFRVNFYLQRGAVGAAFRLIPTEIKSLAQLGMPPAIAQFARLSRGLVLVTGPTGSGKSTTLAALVDLVNETRSDHIVTVEDPIEFLHPNKKSLINQREVGADTMSFANALKHVLRQDPDVILIGELRDLETISVALTAAETGHLVFATLHTQDAPQTIDRIIDVFPPHQQGQVRSQLAATLQGVVCQTLVRRASGTGRTVATEVLVANSAISNLVREGKTFQVTSVLQAGSAQGMHTMDQHLALLVNEGTVTREAALERVHDPDAFGRMVRRSPADERVSGMGVTA